MVKKHTELEVYKRAIAAAMTLFRHSKSFPKEETYSLTDQVRRSSRKRRYGAAFVSKLTDCESEAAETQTWIQFAVECEYLNRETAANLYKEYDEIIAMLVAMIRDKNKWTLK